MKYIITKEPVLEPVLQVAADHPGVKSWHPTPLVCHSIYHASEVLSKLCRQPGILIGMKEDGWIVWRKG